MSGKSHSHSIIVKGLKPISVEIEVKTSRGVPKIIMIGMARRVIREAKQRILSSLKSADIKLKSCRTIINLTPVDEPKNDSHLELAILAALLNNYGLLNIQSKTCFLGQLGLDGVIKTVRHVFALVCLAKKLGFQKIFLAQDDIERVSMIDDLELIGISHIKQLLTGNWSVTKSKANYYNLTPPKYDIDLSDLVGHQQAKRVLTVAAAGRHHLWMVGPPGGGKTLMAQVLRSLLPPLTYQQMLAVKSLYSLKGYERPDRQLLAPPWQDPHHQITAAKLLGGGRPVSPGLITLAHDGILFLDEINLFERRVIESLRQPLENGKIRIDRSGQSQIFPADFVLVAASNPCPCGYYGTNIRPCHCSLNQRRRFQQKVSGAIKDRIDLFLAVSSLKVDQILSRKKSTKREQQNLNSRQEKIKVARKIQQQRYQNLAANCNGQLTGPEIKQYVYVGDNCQQILSRAQSKLQMSNRGIFKTIKVARTIADLATSTQIKKEHIQEALNYRQRPLQS